MGPITADHLQTSASKELEESKATVERNQLPKPLHGAPSTFLACCGLLTCYFNAIWGLSNSWHYLRQLIYPLISQSQIKASSEKSFLPPPAELITISIVFPEHLLCIFIIKQLVSSLRVESALFICESLTFNPYQVGIQ